MYKDEKVILFDGTDLGKWKRRDGKPADWYVKDGILTIKENSIDIVSTEEFGDAFIHVEFRIPETNFNGEFTTGNSGVYIHGRYELQIIYDYNPGEVKDDRCIGSLYGWKKPRVNASLDRMEWQSYDIIFRAARFNSRGDIIVPAIATVFLNGVCVHNNTQFGIEGGGSLDWNQVPVGPLMLQCHGGGDPVDFRNIYFIRLD